MNISELIASCERETCFSSNPGDIRENKHFQAILSMGEAALPEVIASLRADPSWTVEMLMPELTGVMPEIKNAGVFCEVVSFWLGWARGKGL